MGAQFVLEGALEVVLTVLAFRLLDIDSGGVPERGIRGRRDRGPGVIDVARGPATARFAPARWRFIVGGRPHCDKLFPNRFAAPLLVTLAGWDVP